MQNEAKYLSQNEKLALQEIKRRVSALFPVWQYILFGSKARGDGGPDSDADLLIVTERPLSAREKDRITHEMYEANLEYDTLFSRVAVSREEWESKLWELLPLRRSVDREGVAV